MITINYALNYIKYALDVIQRQKDECAYGETILPEINQHRVCVRVYCIHEFESHSVCVL